MLHLSLLSTSLLIILIMLAVIFVTVKLTLLMQRVRQLRSAIQAPKAEPPIEVGSPYLLVNARHGYMLANPKDFYLGRAIIEYGEYGEFEGQFLRRLLPLRPGKVVEIGANNGTHTVSLAKALADESRQLIAFEPQPFIFQNLCANLALSGLINVVAHPWACGAKNEIVYFPRMDYTMEDNFGAVTVTPEPLPNSIAVTCVRLDDIVGTDAVSLIKIDVEGYELQALQGAVETITRSRPILYVENDRIEKSQALIEWLWSQNYQLYWHIPFLFNPDNFFRNQENIYGRIASFNMVCFPQGVEFTMDEAQKIVSATAHPLKQ